MASTGHPNLNFVLVPSTSTSSVKNKSPVLCIHGGFSSILDYYFVAPILSRNYDLILVDLPAHGLSSSATIPYNPRDAAALLANVITKNSPVTGKAHVVGASLGGFTSIVLASMYPDVVDTMFVTGCGRPPTKSAWMRAVEAFLTGSIMPGLVIVIAWLPPSWHKAFYDWQGMKWPEGVQKAQRAAASWSLGWALSQGLMNGGIFTEETIKGVKARTLVCAGERDDGIQGTHDVGELLKKGNRESVAVKAKGMGHIWCLQDEELFSKAVTGWIENAEVVEGLELV